MGVVKSGMVLTTQYHNPVILLFVRTDVLYVVLLHNDDVVVGPVHLIADVSQSKMLGFYEGVKMDFPAQILSEEYPVLLVIDLNRWRHRGLFTIAGSIGNVDRDA